MKTAHEKKKKLRTIDRSPMTEVEKKLAGQVVRDRKAQGMVK